MFKINRHILDMPKAFYRELSSEAPKTRVNIDKIVDHAGIETSNFLINIDEIQSGPLIRIILFKKIYGLSSYVHPR